MNKLLYKVMLIFLKVIPVILALLYCFNSICSCYGIDLYIFSIFGGLSIIPWLFIYITSWLFNFCMYHRIFLYYILLCDIINWIDLLIGIPVSNLCIANIHTILIFITFLISLISYLNYGTRNKNFAPNNN